MQLLSAAEAARTKQTASVDQRHPNGIHRASLDGSGLEDVVTSMGGTFALALDLAAGNVRWA